MCLKILGEIQVGFIFGKSGYCNEGRVCVLFYNILSLVRFYGLRVFGYFKFLRQVLILFLFLVFFIRFYQFCFLELVFWSKFGIRGETDRWSFRVIMVLSGRETIAGVDLRVFFLFGFREYRFENVIFFNFYEYNCCLNKVVFFKVRNIGFQKIVWGLVLRWDQLLNSQSLVGFLVFGLV